MLDIKYIREHAETVKQSIIDRHMNVDLEALLELDIKRRALLTDIESMKAERNAMTKGSTGKPSDEDLAKLKKMSTEIKEKEATFPEVHEAYEVLLKQVPNNIHPETPIGGEEDFVVVDTAGTIPTLANAKDHEALLIACDGIDFERGAKVVGSKFYYAKGDLVRLNMALLNYGMDIATKHGFTLLETPDLAHNSVCDGAGYSPRGNESQIYNVEGTDLSLIGTAEITTLGYHKDEVLDLSQGPIRYAAISHCFRREAGAYGRTSKGLYRVHQFTKLELFSFCKPEDSEDEHQFILSVEKEIADGLELAYRVIDIPSGDLGAPAYRKYDLEAWMVMAGDEGEAGGYGEITSTSNCTDFQARRMNIRYKDTEENLQFVHTLNGTAIVLSRFPIALIEQKQQADGSIAVPKVLQSYLGGKDMLFSA